MPESESKAKLLQSVMQSTKEGKLRWEATESPGVFRAIVELTALLVSKAANAQVTTFAFSMRDSQGNELINETARKYFTGRADSSFSLLEELHELARRSAFDVDRKVNQVLNILRKP